MCQYLVDVGRMDDLVRGRAHCTHYLSLGRAIKPFPGAGCALCKCTLSFMEGVFIIMKVREPSIP